MEEFEGKLFDGNYVENGSEGVGLIGSSECASAVMQSSAVEG